MRLITKGFTQVFGVDYYDTWAPVAKLGLIQLLLFHAHKGNNVTILACYVNDCTITGNSQVLVQSYKDKLKNKYSLTDLGTADWLLGMRITRDLEA